MELNIRCVRQIMLNAESNLTRSYAFVLEYGELLLNYSIAELAYHIELCKKARYFSRFNLTFADLRMHAWEMLGKGFDALEQIKNDEMPDGIEAAFEKLEKPTYRFVREICDTVYKQK